MIMPSGPSVSAPSALLGTTSVPTVTAVPTDPSTHDQGRDTSSTWVDSESQRDTERLARFKTAVAWTDSLIERDSTPVGKSPAEIRERAEFRLARVRRFLAQLGDPHRQYPVIHVGGTSGKGSTSTAISAMLHAAGYRVGLHTSPYLQTPAEKIQIDQRLIAPEVFADLVALIQNAHEEWLAAGESSLTYGEVWVSLFALAFARANVDIAVVEVGAGGRFDLTNVVHPAVSVITSVGLDHTVTLGPTIPEIAWHKAGIIKRGAPVVTAVTDPSALSLIEAEARQTGSPLTCVIPDVTFRAHSADLTGTQWSAWDTATNAPVGPMLPAPPGGFQAGNAAVAVAAVRALTERDPSFAVSEDAMRSGLAATRIPGRFETVSSGAVVTETDGNIPIILDGAHNSEKIAALVTAIDHMTSGGRHSLIVVLGVLDAKHHEVMVRLLVERASAFVLTAPAVLAKPAATVAALASEVTDAGFSGPTLTEADPQTAVERAFALAAGTPNPLVLMTGSLYLIGNVRGRWYPTDTITLTGTPWPSIGAG